MLTQKQYPSFVLIDKDEHITNKSKKIYKYKKEYKLFQIIKKS